VLRTLGYCMDFKLTRLARIVAGTVFAGLKCVLAGSAPAQPRTSETLCRRQSAPANESA
jgi:hypothetical protein